MVARGIALLNFGVWGFLRRRCAVCSSCLRFFAMMRRDEGTGEWNLGGVRKRAFMSAADELLAYEPEPGWEEMIALRTFGYRPMFVSGDPEGDRIRVRYFVNSEDRRLMCKAWFGHGSQGPPGHAHGGSISALLDESMGFAAWVAGHMVVAAQLNINFRSMVPIDKISTCEAWVEDVQGRKITTRSRLFSQDGVTCSDGTALFLTLTAEQFDKAKDKYGELQQLKQE